MDASGKPVFYEYDWRGKLPAVKDRNGETLAAYAHTPGERLKEIRHGNRALKSGSGWLRSHRNVADDYADRAGDYAAMARDYADRGGRMLAKRAEREPMAVVVGLGLAAYVIGSLLSSASAREPAAAPARKRAASANCGHGWSVAAVTISAASRRRIA